MFSILIYNFSDFQFFLSLFQIFWDYSKCTIYSCYYRHLHISLAKIQACVYIFAFFYFQSVVRLNDKINEEVISFFFFFN